jgi:hypothetical protein
LTTLFSRAHFLAPSPRRFQQGKVDPAFARAGNTGNQRPIDLIYIAVAELGGDGARRRRIASQQQDAAGVLIQPVDQARLFRSIKPQCVEHRVQMVRRLAAALNRQAAGFVQRNQCVVAKQHARLQLGGYVSVDGCGGIGRLRLWRRNRRKAYSLAFQQALAQLGAPAVDADLPGTEPLRQLAIGNIGKRAAQPAVEADGFVVGADFHMTDRSLPAVRVKGHTRTRRIRRNPANSASIETATETTT